MSVHALCSLIAQLVLLQFTRDRLALGAPVRDTILEYCAYTHRTVPAQLARQPQCPCAHLAYQRTAPPRALADCTLRELANIAAPNVDDDRAVSFEVDDYTYDEQQLCSCGEQQTVHRFARADARDIGRCQHCHRPLARRPFYSLRPVPASALDQSIAKPLRELGAADARWVLVRRDGEAVLFLNPPPSPDAPQP